MSNAGLLGVVGGHLRKAVPPFILTSLAFLICSLEVPVQLGNFQRSPNALYFLCLNISNPGVQNQHAPRRTLVSFAFVANPRHNCHKAAYICTHAPPRSLHCNLKPRKKNPKQPLFHVSNSYKLLFSYYS